MRHFYLIVLAMTATLPAMAQKTTVTGIFKDSVHNETEPYATVRVYKQGKTNKPFAMSLTDADGNIKQDINGKGKFIISFNSVGKKEIRREITLNGQPTYSLGEVNTCDDANSLKGVEVVAQKPLVKMETDKMSYSVEDDVDAKAATVLDMLRKVPMVTVDGQDNITVNGSSNFKVYVNDKPNPMFNSNAAQILKSMPASMVKSIEVVTNPGARYDAEGAGGILNIVLASNDGKKGSMNGYNGNVSLRYGTRGGRISGFLSGQQGKFSYSANATYNKEQYDNSKLDMTRSYNNGSTMRYTQTSEAKMPYAMGNISLGYEIDSLNSINANAGISYWNMKYEGNPRTSMYGGMYGSGFSYSSLMKQSSPSTSFNGSIDYQHYFNGKRTDYMILSYLFTSNPRKNESHQYYQDADSTMAIVLNDFFSKGDNHGKEHTIQADFTNQISKTQKINYGAKYINRRNSSDSKYYDIDTAGNEILNSQNSVDYKNTQSIVAGYGEWNGSFGKLGTKAGIRYEHTFENVNFNDNDEKDFKKDYGTLVPNASISWNIAQTMNIGMNYNMRIVRPGISYLSPFVDRSNPTSISYGNTNLDVEKSHYVKLVFNFFTQKFMVNATLGQNFCNNQIAQYSFLDNKGILNQTYGNNVKNRWTNFNMFINWMIHKNTRIMLSGGVDYGDMRSAQLDARNHGWQGNAYLGLQQTLPWELQWSLGTFCNSKRYNIQGYNGGASFLFTTLSKSFLNDKLNIAANFVTSYKGHLDIKQYSRGKDFVNNMKIHVPITQAAITLTYKFGNTNKQFRQHQSNISNDFSEKSSDNQSIGNITSGQKME